MKAAKAKEAASLPRRPEPARGALPPDLEQGVAPPEAERTALLQASSFMVLQACVKIAGKLTEEGEVLIMQSNNESQVGHVGCFPGAEAARARTNGNSDTIQRSSHR